MSRKPVYEPHQEDDEGNVEDDDAVTVGLCPDRLVHGDEVAGAGDEPRVCKRPKLLQDLNIQGSWVPILVPKILFLTLC